MEIISKSWNSLSKEIASEYLKSFGSPATGSNEIIEDIFPKLIKNKINPKILDLGCGNGHLYKYFKSSGLNFRYTGVDFSKPLVEAAKVSNKEADFILCDINKLSKHISGKFDLIVYSHVLEMLESPELSLFEARKFSKLILIKFFEPPNSDFDKVELKEMDLGLGSVPYLRRKMSKKYYQLILANLGCKKVDIYCDNSKDEVHVLYF